MGGKDSALVTVLLFLAHAPHTGAQQIFLVAIAHFYTVTDVYTVLHKFQSIFFSGTAAVPLCLRTPQRWSEWVIMRLLFVPIVKNDQLYNKGKRPKPISVH